jgi:hypothetical protein
VAFCFVAALVIERPQAHVISIAGYIKQSKAFAKVKGDPWRSPSTFDHVRTYAATGDPPDPDPSSLCASPSFPASSASIWTVDQVLGRH